MKTGTIFVLLAFIVRGLEVTWAHKSPVKGRQTPGFCPEVPKGTPGACAEMCSGDDSCPRGMKCCSNGRGHSCTTPVFQKGRSGGHGKVGQKVY
ncbi:WAP four-disulfide core domain protein 18-like [Oryx dammah]|uniref:WAP four-disulfide core domain protein 18-like n=1 Tax=Oryx dammah TaxID=59534 RepID=UPI001A9A7C42|nr:WAP four-disulfide core domain protein 18-like [Oryx dammah]